MKDPSHRSEPEDQTVDREDRIADLVRRLDTAQRYLDIADLILVALNDQGEITFINPKGCELLGYAPDQLLGESWFSTCVPDRERPAVVKAFGQLMAGQIDPIEFFENPVVTRSGEEKIIAWHNSLLVNDQEVVQGTMSAGRDVTQQKKSQDALENNMAWHRLILDQVQAAVIVHGADTSILLANRQAAEMLGLGVDSLRGRKVGDPAWHFIREDGSRMDQEEYPISRVMKDGAAVEDLIVGLNWGEDRPVVWALVNAYPVLDPAGNLDQIIVSFIDITSLKSAEEERRNLETKILHTQKLESLGVLAGGIAHDFNNLLMGIMGNAELASMDLPAGSMSKECLGDIESACARAADLCRQMLAYSGKGRFNIGQADLSEIVSEMGHLLNISVSKKVGLVYDLAADLPKVEGDVTQIEQVVMNLITNASEAMGSSPGKVRISTGVVAGNQVRPSELEAVAGALQAGPYVYLQVSDEGCGMDAATKGRIFDPFFSTKFTGRGLGLAAVLGIIRSHAGAIGVESEPDKGTTVRVLLPATDKKAIPVPVSAATPTEIAPGGTVLLVDDEAVIRETTSRILRQLGFEVVTAIDGLDALDVFAEHSENIVCVLLDLTMPRMGGEEALDELRKIRKDVPVLLSSGYNEQEVTQKFTGLGLAGFIQKPYRVAQLDAALRKVMAK